MFILFSPIIWMYAIMQRSYNHADRLPGQVSSVQEHEHIYIHHRYTYGHTAAQTRTLTHTHTHTHTPTHSHAPPHTHTHARTSFPTSLAKETRYAQDSAWPGSTN